MSSEGRLVVGLVAEFFFWLLHDSATVGTKEFFLGALGIVRNIE